MSGPVVPLIVLAVALLASWGATGMVRRYALRRAILDIPNARSSHTVPTPRGGGLAIVMAVLAGVMAGALLGLIDRSLALALVGGGSLVAIAGWVDDHGHVPARWRALCHATAAAFAVWMLGGLDGLRIGAVTIPLGWLGSIVAVVGVVWAVNLYNFMDGIDGLAGMEAVTVAAAAAILSFALGRPALAFASALMAVAAAGFLIWNWPPARIFMGDVGSGFIGYALAVLAIASETRGGVPLLMWVLLLGVFIVDATFTLVRRMMRGEQWYAAHRTHAYQRAVRAGWPHRKVTLVCATLNLGLGLLAAVGTFIVAAQPAVAVLGIIFLILAYWSVERRLSLGDALRAEAESGCRAGESVRAPAAGG